MNRIAHLLSENAAVRREWQRRFGPEREPRIQAITRWAITAATLIVYLAATTWFSDSTRTPWEARTGLGAIVTLLLLALTFVAPPAAATAIAGERDRDTWRALRLTRLTAGEVLLARWLGALWPGLAMTLAALPVLWIGASSSRLPIDQTAALTLVVLLVPLSITSVGLWLSARCRRTSTALLLSYALTATGIWGTLIWIEALAVRGENWWWYASPVWQSWLLIFHAPNTSPLRFPLLPEWLWFALGQVAVIGGSWLLALRRLRGDFDEDGD